MQRKALNLPRVTTLVSVVLAAAMLGAMIPAYVSALGDGYEKLMALPAALVLLFLTVYSRTTLLLLIVLLRGSTENAFEGSRFAIGGSQIGIGGLINGFAILIAILLIVERPKRLSSRIVKVWAPFIVILLIGTAITPNRPDGARLFLQLLSSAAVFIGAYYFVRDTRSYKTSLWLVFWSSVGPALFGYYELASGGGHEFGAEGLRIRSTFSHPNVLAFYLTLLIPVTFYILKSATFSLTQGRKIWMGLYLIALLGLLALTKTRSAWVATAAIFAAYAFFFERRYFVYLVLAALAALFIPGVGDRLIDITHGTGGGISSADQLNSFAWRQALWESGLSWMTPSHYLLGYGTEAFRFLAPVFFKEGGGGNWGAHSVYVEIFFEFGIAGSAAFASMWVQIYLATKPIARYDRLTAFMLAVVATQYLVSSVSDNMLQYLSVNWYLWFVLGAGMAYASLHAKTEPVVPRWPAAPGPT